MLYKLSAFRLHSSPDPFGATLPPGEGIFPPRVGAVAHTASSRKSPFDNPSKGGYTGPKEG